MEPNSSSTEAGTSFWKHLSPHAPSSPSHLVPFTLLHGCKSLSRGCKAYPEGEGAWPIATPVPERKRAGVSQEHMTLGNRGHLTAPCW